MLLRILRGGSERWASDTLGNQKFECLRVLRQAESSVLIDILLIDIFSVDTNVYCVSGLVTSLFKTAK